MGSILRGFWKDICDSTPIMVPTVTGCLFMAGVVAWSVEPTEHVVGCWVLRSIPAALALFGLGWRAAKHHQSRGG